MAQSKRPGIINVVTYSIDKASKVQFEKAYEKLNKDAAKMGRPKIGKGTLLGKIIETATPLIDVETFYPTTATA